MIKVKHAVSQKKRNQKSQGSNFLHGNNGPYNAVHLVATASPDDPDLLHLLIGTFFDKCVGQIVAAVLLGAPSGLLRRAPQPDGAAFLASRHVGAGGDEIAKALLVGEGVAAAHGATILATPCGGRDRWPGQAGHVSADLEAFEFGLVFLPETDAIRQSRPGIDQEKSATSSRENKKNQMLFR